MKNSIKLTAQVFIAIMALRLILLHLNMAVFVGTITFFIASATYDLVKSRIARKRLKAENLIIWEKRVAEIKAQAPKNLKFNQKKS